MLIIKKFPRNFYILIRCNINAKELKNKYKLIFQPKEL